MQLTLRTLGVSMACLRNMKSIFHLQKCLGHFVVSLPSDPAIHRGLGARTNNKDYDKQEGRARRGRALRSCPPQVTTATVNEVADSWLTV